jgi:DNA-binding XRE family transcriptional regulator
VVVGLRQIRQEADVWNASDAASQSLATVGAREPPFCTGTIPSARFARGAQNGVFCRVGCLLGNSRYVAQAAELAGKLRERRESAGITQERLASMADVGIATVRKIETGVVIEPGYFTVMALMSALGTSPEELGM